MKYQTIFRIRELLEADARDKHKTAMEARAAFNKECESRMRSVQEQVRLGAAVFNLSGPPEGKVLEAEHEADEADAILRDFMNSDWRC